jgi:hypothetical protein
MSEQTAAERWAEHLQALGLTKLEALAQSASYRVRGANSYQFDLEYTGGLARYRRPGKRLRTFTSAEEATAYLTQVKREMEEYPETWAGAYDRTRRVALSGLLRPIPLLGAETQRDGGHCGMKKTAIEHSRHLNRRMMRCSPCNRNLTTWSASLSRNEHITTHWPGA